jgi:hypothetical protein
MGAMNTPRTVTFLLLCTTLSAVSMSAGMPPLLDEALKKEREQEYHWAFTETVEARNGKGEVHDSMVVRYDPSKPYAEQYTPLSVDGKPPSNSVIHECRQRGEDEARERQKKFEKGEDNAPDAPEIEISDDKGIIELQNAVLFEESDRYATFKVPVRAKSRSSFPFETILFLLKVNKTDSTLDSLQMTVSQPMRINLTARIRGADIQGTYTKVDPAYPPQITSAEIQADIKFLFAKSSARVSIKRSEFKHVKPYDDRFTVKMGPLKTLGF